MRWAPVALALLALLPAGCDWLTCPTTFQGCDEPPLVEYPAVAGAYAGVLTATSEALSEPVTGVLEVSVLQSERDVTLWRPTAPAGVPLIPGMIGEIDPAGAFTLTGGGKDYDPECGVVTLTALALSFSERTARFNAALSTELCGGFRLEASLERRTA